MLAVLLEIPPHGCGRPWPGMVGSVAEWWWVGSELRPFARAGRRSAGLGRESGTRAHTHTVGVRGHGASCVPQTGCGDVADGATCSVVVHTRLFDGAKVVFFCSNSERDGGVCALAGT